MLAPIALNFSGCTGDELLDIEQMASTRIVIVDDHELARRGLRSVLENNPDLQVIAEVASGEEAVERAEELHPDIILLDITLPRMSGIEAASRIHQGSPTSRVIFVSQHDSVVLAKDAMRAGGCAYVVKSDAGRDLLPAISAVQAGETFVSRTLLARGWKS